MASEAAESPTQPSAAPCHAASIPDLGVQGLGLRV